MDHPAPYTLETFHEVTRRLAEDVSVDRVELVGLTENPDAAFLIAASDDATVANQRLDLNRYPEVGEVMRTGKPIVLSHPLLASINERIAPSGILVIAAFPVAIGSTVLGVLLLRDSHADRVFSTRELNFLTTVSYATAVALRNAKFLESAERRVDQLESYEAFFAHVSEGIAILDRNAEVLSINPAGAALLDLDATDALGRHINSLTNPIEDSIWLEVLLAVSKGQVRRGIDVSGRTLAGRRLTLNAAAAPLEENGSSTIVSFRDVTSERELAKELNKTSDFLERSIDSSVDGIISADMRGRIILYNKGAHLICGWTPDEAIGKLNVRDLYASPATAKDVMSRLRKGKGRVGVMRQEILSKSGQKIPVNITAAIIFEGTREIATVGIFTDIRERMELEHQLSTAKDRLNEAEKNAVIVALAGAAAHELNQPLTSVMGYAELVRRKLKPGDYAFRPVDTIYREAERMAEIVRKIGKITRYETKSYIGEAEIVDLDKASTRED